jgi:hypothetical protein
MENAVQFSDGSMAYVNAEDAVNDLHIGGVLPTPTAVRRICERVGVLKIANVNTAGGVFAWSPGQQIIVTRAVLHVKTVATAACTLSIGVAANATTLNDTLMEGVDVHTAAGIFDNLANPGTDGLDRVLVGATQYITGSVASGASAGLVGYVYLHYYPTF